MPMHCCFEPNAISSGGGAVTVAAPIVGSGSPSDPIDYRWSAASLTTFPASLSAWVVYTTNDTPGTATLPTSPVTSDMVTVAVPGTATNAMTLSSAPNTFEDGTNSYAVVRNETATFLWNGAVWTQTA